MSTFGRRLHHHKSAISDRGANCAGHPAGIAFIAVVCAAWFLTGGQANEKALALPQSVLTIALILLVLDQQRQWKTALHRSFS